MPVEVKELIIRAVVDSELSDDTGPDTAVYNDTEMIIAECVDQVLTIIKREKER